MNLYEFLGTTPEEVYQIIENKKDYYLTYKIKKRSGKLRRIDAPQGKLKQIQNQILYKILYKYRAHPIAHGFVKGRSPKTNAMEHLGAEVLITMDIIDFFTNIKEKKVFYIINYLFNKKKHYSGFVSDDIEILTQLLTYRGSLCQGAPTSPTLSNLAVLKMDKELSEFTTTNALKITRYSDDLAISSKVSKDRETVKSYIRGVSSIIIGNGFRVNFKKTKVRRTYQRMQITGVVINEKPNIKRTDWRNFRAKLHNILKEGKKLNETQLQQLRGYVEWVSSINPNRGKQFLKQYDMILKLP